MTPLPPVRANGAVIPALGLGTWRLEGEACARIVAGALAQGYRHVDTAAMYGNEEAVGEGLRASGLARDEVFVTTKVWYEVARPGALERSAEASLRRLGLDRVDLLLIHWPNPDVPVAESVRALAEAQRRGLARHVGVSNFTAAMVDEAVAASGEPLVANQCEYHPYLDQAKVLAACRRHGLAFTSYSPLGRGDLLADATVGAIAAARGRSPAQVILRWHVQQAGVVAIPKSSNLERIGQNLAIGDFALTDAEMQRLHALARPDGRLVSPSFAPAWDEAA